MTTEANSDHQSEQFSFKLDYEPLEEEVNTIKSEHRININTKT